MARDIKYLAKDIELDFSVAIAHAASEIAYTLQETGPWWTGSFGKSWKISSSPVQPSKPRVPKTNFDVIPEQRPRQPKPVPPTIFNVGRSTYIGNEAEHAGFSINQRGATRPNKEGFPVTYWEHIVVDGYKSTVPDFVAPSNEGKPSWFYIYLKHKYFLTSDLHKGFAPFGFDKFRY